MKTICKIHTVLAFCLFLSAAVRAQTTEFTYQGNLQISGTAASGNYDFEFLIFDALSGGSQLGSTLTRNLTAVSAGSFSVKLDFGSQFPGANRYLEIHVRPAGGGAFTPLTPRQIVNSAPYSIKTLAADTATNATLLGGVAASQYVLTGDARLSDPRTPIAGSANYIQNTASPQSSSNFNVSGNGTAGGTLSANIIRANTQFNIGANKILGSSVNNDLAVGIGAGGSVSSLIGLNTFIGDGAGASNGGDSNSFVGTFSGSNNGSGSKNTLVGFQSNVGSGGLQNAVAIGANSMVTQSNSLVLGSVNGVNNATADTSVGIGTTAPVSRLHLNGNSSNFALTFTNSANTAGRRGYRLAFDSDRFSFQRADDSGNFSANQMVIDQASGNVGIGTPAPNAKLQVVGGNLYIAQPNSLIITSPNGACWFITVNNAGAVSTISVTCP